MKQIKVAIVGAGRMAEEHIKVFSAIEDVVIAGIHSRTRGRAELLAARHGILSMFDSVGKMYEATSADLLIIAVSELGVRNVCMEAFQHPWVCLIEKPAGYDLEDAQIIAAAARTMGRRAYVALNRRHYSSTRAVLEQLNESDGQRLVNAFDQEDPLAALEAGRPRLVVENWMYANSIHVVDYLRLFCRGDVTDVEHVVRWKPDASHFVVAKVSFSSGDIGIYQGVWNAPGPWSIAVSTQAKRWEMRPLERAISQIYKSRENEMIEIHPWDVKFKPGLRRQAEETIKVIRGESHSLPSLEDGIATMKLVKQIYAT